MPAFHDHSRHIPREHQTFAGTYAPGTGEVSYRPKPRRICVSPTGEDAAVGDAASPLRTLAGARAAIRRLKASGEWPKRGVEVVLADGTYDGTRFCAEDSGLPGAPVVYRAANRTQAVLSGAVKLDWRDEGDGTHSAVIPGQGELPGFLAGGFLIDGYTPRPLALFQDGRRLPVACWPDEGWANAGACLGGTGEQTHEGVRYTHGVYRVPEDKLQAWTREPDLWAKGLWFYKWADFTRPVQIDAGKGVLTVCSLPDAFRREFGYRSGASFRIMNAVSEMNRPGEWVIDRKNRRFRIRTSPGGAAVFAGKASLLSGEGLHDVVFDGLTVEYAAESAVDFKYVTNVTFRAGVVRHVGGYGISAIESSNVRVSGCEIYDIGEGGVRLSGGWGYSVAGRHAPTVRMFGCPAVAQTPGDWRIIPSGNVAENNEIFNYGKVIPNYRPGISLGGVGCRAEHNLIHHSDHQAIQFFGNDHVITWNVIHDVCMDNCDAAAIYACEKDFSRRGTEIAHNLIYMVGTKPATAHTHAIYLDDWTCGCRVHHNLINRASDGIVLNGGQDNLVCSNLVVNAQVLAAQYDHGPMSSCAYACRPGRESRVMKILYADRARYESKIWRTKYPRLAELFTIKDAVFAHTALFGRIEDNVCAATGFGSQFVIVPAPDIKANTVVRGNLRTEGDPGFVDYAGFDWRLRPNSAAGRKLGDLGFDKMGLYAHPDRVSPPKKFGTGVFAPPLPLKGPMLPYVDVVATSATGRVTLRENGASFVRTAPGKGPSGFAVSWKFRYQEDDAFVFAPAAVYDGNRPFRPTGDWRYPPGRAAAQAGAKAPLLQSHAPALARDGSGSIELTSGDMSVPCVGVFFQEAQRAFLLLTEQQVGGKNVGFRIRKGEIRVDFPADRERAYRFRAEDAKRPDEGVTLAAGEGLVTRFKVLEFPCPSKMRFLEAYLKHRNDILPRTPVKPYPDMRALAKCVAEAVERDWWNEAGHYGVGDGRKWTVGFTQGMHLARALHLVGDETGRRHARQCVDWLVAHQYPSGFYMSEVDDAFMLPGSGRPVQLVRRSAEALFRLTEFIEDGGDVPEVWRVSAEKCAEALVRIWKTHGQLGQAVDPAAGEILIGGSASAAIAPAALARAGRALGRRDFIKAAIDLVQHYQRTFLDCGYTCGGPSDALSAPDSESAFALLESYVTLAEVTGSKGWADWARLAARIAATWVVPYAYAFPADSEFARLGVNTTGAVFANVQNKHAAPGIATWSGSSLLRLYRLTGEPDWLELAQDIASFVPQVISTDARPVRARLEDGTRKALPSGWINERVNMSDWEGADRVGEVFDGPCWCATAFLLSCGELFDTPEFRRPHVPEVPVTYHSRHIPLEHLKFNSYARATNTKSLTEVLEPDKLDDLKRWGVGTIELRFAWWALERQKGVFDWSRLDRDMAKVEAGGLKCGLMAWFFYPPPWYDGPRFHCIPHDADAATLSPWAPETLSAADRVYGLIAQRYGKRIDFVYTMGSGDYGEPTLPHGVTHYKFASGHTHSGIGWAGDKCARAAWAKLSDRPIEDVLAGKADRATGLKYMDFLADTTSRYPAEIFKIVRRHFPWARYGLPIGHHSEYPNGMNRALIVKRMCEVSTNLTVRWTSLGVFREFGKSNVFARRIESACRFYGCAFGEETSHPAVLADENLSSHAAYELVANEVSMLHNDYACMAQAGARNLARMRAFPRSPKVCDVALLWPDVGEKLYALRGPVVSDNRYTEAFVAKAGAFRQRTDYWICDTQMIRDGFLEKMGITRLVALEPIEPETEPYLAAFRARGGRVSDGSDFPPPPSPLVYRTVHRDFISTFTPSTGEISFLCPATRQTALDGNFREKTR